MGLAFKENCRYIRNTRAIDIVAALREYSIDVDIYDPWVTPEEALNEYGLKCATIKPDTSQYDAIVVAVGHKHFTELGISGIRQLEKTKTVIYDVKAIFPRDATDGRL
jgi:UDP-N-acetyl-D-glucosamine/UDP-N-acetyl-D-galactosamine dehydrogenase